MLCDGNVKYLHLYFSIHIFFSYWKGCKIELDYGRGVASIVSENISCQEFFFSIISCTVNDHLI